MRTSSPYVTENTLQYKDYLENKKKWIHEKGLLPVINKPKPNFIPNKVNFEIPYGKPIASYNFRDYF